MSTTTTFPGPTTPRPIQALRFFRDPFGYFGQMQAEYGDMFRVHIADEKPWHVLSRPEHVKQVFTGSPDLFHAGKANSVLLPLLGDHSVLLLDGAGGWREGAPRDVLHPENVHAVYGVRTTVHTTPGGRAFLALADHDPAPDTLEDHR